MALRPINMIPPDILAKTTLFRHLWFWSKGLICIFLVFVILYLAQTHWFSLQQKAHNSDASMLGQVQEQIDRTMKDTARLKEQMQDLKLKAGLLATMANRQFYHDILAVLADSFNDATWLDHLSVQRGSETDRSVIMIEGFSMTHNTLGLFLESLADIPRVRDVVLIDSKKDEPPSSGDPNLFSSIRFKLSCSIVKAVSK